MTIKEAVDVFLVVAVVFAALFGFGFGYRFWLSVFKGGGL